MTIEAVEFNQILNIEIFSEFQKFQNSLFCLLESLSESLVQWMNNFETGFETIDSEIQIWIET